MKTQQELCDILGFIAEYATYQLGSGVHTSRVIRNAQRIGEALGVWTFSYRVSKRVRY